MKFVATDIDGTILPHGGEISKRTVRTFSALGDAGVPFVLVTARPPRWMRRVADAMGTGGRAIIANGAAVMDLSTSAIENQTTITAEHMLEVAAVLRSELPGVKLAVESAEGMSIEREGTPHSMDFPPHEVGLFEDLAAVQAGAVFKVLAHAKGNGGADAMIARIAPLLNGIADTSHSGVDDSLLELSPHGVTKASALERYAGALGFAAMDVLAFGDAPNDIPMLSWAGTSYAVGNGHPDAKAAANHVAERSEDDGVARVLEELFDL